MYIKKGPWTVVDTKDVYSNPWIKVREDKVIRPDGKDGIFGVVSMKAGVSVLPIDDKNNVYLTKEYHYAVEDEKIEVMSGGIDGNENKIEAAKRELKEELGIEAQEWIDMGMIDPFTTVVNSPNYLYLAKNLTFFMANLEGTENIKVLKIPFNEAFEMVEQGLITHGASVALLLKAKNYLSKI